MNNANNAVLACHNLHKSFNDGVLNVDVLKGINLTVKAGERIAIVGPSGSGKSTLLQLLGGLDEASQGDIFIDNQALRSLNEKQLCKLRNRQLGFIYQFHHLLPEFTALENVAMPLLIAKMPVKHAFNKAKDILTKVGLEKRLQHKVGQLSGGERQRTAIVRALVNQPRCILADEPTGNLDQATASKSYDVMLELNQAMNTSMLVVTHDLNLAKRMDRILSLQEGQLQEIVI